MCHSMEMGLNKVIGAESDFPAEHRLFNIVLLIGILLAVVNGIFNYCMGLGIAIISICFLCSIVFTILYYVSVVKKKYATSIVILISMCVFFIIPGIWIVNGGILGGTTLFIVLTASVIPSLLSGLRRLVLFGCLVIVTLALIIVEYNHPLWITGYISDVQRYLDVAFSLICIMIANASLLTVVRNYYMKEYQRSRDYQVQIEKQKMESAMSQLDRMNLIGEMAASIGHEIRNPLTTVRGYLQFFSMKENFAEYEENFGLMIQELDRANLIITEFLSLAKNKKVDLASNNLNVIISQIYPLIQADAIGAGKNIILQLGDIPNILMDENEIKQYILNLVRNGLEAIKYKGVVSITTYMDDENIILEIEDDGDGIDKDVLGKLGTPFVTTKDSGTGIGIPICYRIAEHHNAKLDIETSSAGTTFTIKFKLLETNAPLAVSS